MFRSWINLLCLASMNDPRGDLPSVEDMAFRLRKDEDAMNGILVTLSDTGLIEQCHETETYLIHNWHERQFESDNSTERVRKHRALKQSKQVKRSRNVSET